MYFDRPKSGSNSKVYLRNPPTKIFSGVSATTIASCHLLLCNSPRRRFTESVRPFPSFTPRKPGVVDSELVQHITMSIKQQRSESLYRVLRRYECKLRPDHLVWVLMNIRGDYKLVLGFFDWASMHRELSLEARCIVIQIAVASKDYKMARSLIYDFWMKPGLDVAHAYT
ncbi:Pentatricopeptide repeat-containing protein [Drosera capensis]